MASQELRLCQIEKWLAEQRKPKAVVEYSTPLFFATHTLKFQPDPWQARVLSWAGNRMLLNCSRQSGKSTTTAILALHRALFVPRSLILLVSPTQRQSSELFKKVTEFLNLLPKRPKLVEDNQLSLQLANGSRIVSLPAKESNVRGFSGASLIIEDEASRASDDLYLALRPMLAVSGGKLILMSTPWGKRGHFHNAWEHGGTDWERILIPASQCPRISPEFLAEEKRTMPEWWFRQEYGCEFTETEDSVFGYDLVQNALLDDIHLLFDVSAEPSAKVEILGLDDTVTPLFPEGK